MVTHTFNREEILGLGYDCNTREENRRLNQKLFYTLKKEKQLSQRRKK